MHTSCMLSAKARACRMATAQVRRLLKLAALPVAGSAGLALGIPVLKAEAVPNSGEPKRKTVLPKDLSIYDDMANDYRFVPVDTSGYLYQAVSAVRQNVWKFSDSIQGAVEKTKQAYRFAEKAEKDIIDYIKMEEGFYPRVSAITLAGLTGMVIARKGGVFRKAIYSGTLMAATASLCYPYQVVKITKAEYEALQTFWRNSVGSGVIDRVQVRMGQRSDNKTQDSEPKEPVLVHEHTSATDDNVAETAPSTETNQPPADHGMSNPEDKDMYTTRT